MNRRVPVLVVRPRPSRALGAYYRNLGITMLATHLQAAGMEPVLADLTFDSWQDSLGSGARAAAFSLYIDDFAEGARLAAEAGEAGIHSAVGGPHATLLGRDVLSATSAFTVIGVGDCLPAAVPVIARLAAGEPTGGPVIVGTPGMPAAMDSRDPDFALWPDDGRYFPVFPVEFSRGCRQHCPFCTDPVLRRGLAADPVGRTLATLRRLAAGRDPLWIRFTDSSLSSLGPDLDRLLDALITSRLPVQWSAYAYPHDITPGLAAKLAAAGCRALFLGIESLAPGVRVGKHHAKDPDIVARAVTLLRDQGIFSHGNFIIGLPGETTETVETTLDAIERIGFDSVGGGPFYLTPGSTFERLPGSHGITITDPQWKIRQHLNFYDPAHEYFRTATLTQAEIKSLASWFRREVENRHSACWNLSDYALLCWLSAGGTAAGLKNAWAAPPDTLTADETLVIGVLKEKAGVTPADPAGLVGATRRVASRQGAHQ